VVSVLIEVGETRDRLLDSLSTALSSSEYWELEVDGDKKCRHCHSSWHFPHSESHGEGCPVGYALSRRRR
jgi:cytochrome c peroxidase